MKLLLLLLNGAKLGKVMITGGTMLLSVFVYAQIYGWKYAAGFVGLMFVHELGHYIAARRRGLDVGIITFVPLLGAWTELKNTPHNVETEAYVGIAGPLLGTLTALACYFLARSYDNNLLLAVSYAGFFINLFNLIPMMPFDGGRITAVLSPRIWLLGVPIFIGFFMWRPSPMLIIIALMAAPQVMKAWNYDPQAPENQAYYAISSEQRFSYATYYLLLGAFLAVMTHDVHEMLEGLHAVGASS